MRKVMTENMGDNIHLADYFGKWVVVYADPIGEGLERQVILEEFEGEDAEAQARKWVADYHENRASISYSEGW